MKQIIFISIIFCMIISSCHEITVGYLETNDAKYNPDTMVISKILVDTIYPMDGDKKWDKNKPDWVSPCLQGFLGTSPIFISLKKVVASDGGDADIFMKEVILRGNGAFVIPVENNIPLGIYTISLNLKNEGYSSDLNDIFTVVVKEKQ